MEEILESGMFEGTTGSGISVSPSFSISKWVELALQRYDESYSRLERHWSMLDNLLSAPGDLEKLSSREPSIKRWKSDVSDRDEFSPT